MAIGFDIVIPDKLITKLAEADKRLKTISQTSEETKNRVVRAFNQMTLSADEFLKKLQQINTEVGKLGNVKLQITTTNTTQSVDDINKLIQLTEKLTAAQKKQLEAQARAELTKKAKSDAQETTKRQISKEQRLTAQIKAQNAELSAEYKRRSKENIAIADNEARKRIAASRLATNEIIAQMQRETRFRIQEANRIAKLTQTPTTITRKDVGRIIDVSRNATSINQMQTAIKNLEKAKRDLDTTDKKYDKTIKAINKEIENQKQRLKELGVQMDNYKSKSSNLLNISEQLTRRLALVFSVSQITGYVKKLASVRGEFELQQKSLAAIIQNKDKANEIFDKVTKLAVQSPFQLKELVTYTKQLAAYKIETGKIYDNMKMLADISAGVGVDMSRLVLAYGQVAAANYLRGTELRQFSEAGVNILGGLADYFSELQGRAVGVAEVFDMVSRRMVKFSDVEAVLRKTTEAGGEFYNMQAIQAQTLKGQISNLKDSIEIMLNDIGKSQEGKLKGGVALVRDLVENWRAFASVLQDVSFALVIKGTVDLYKGFRIAKEDLGSFIEEAKGLPKIAASIKKMFFDIQKVIVAHPYIALAAAIAVVGKALWDWNKAVEAQNKVYKENSATLSNEMRNIEKLKDEYEQFSNAIVKAETDMQVARNNNDQDAYNKAQKDANLARREQLELLDKLKREYPEIYEGLKSEKVGIEELTIAIEEYNDAKRTQIALNEGKKASFWGGDSEGENINDAQSEINEYIGLLETAKGKIGQTLSKLDVNFYKGIINEEQYEEAKKLLLDTEKAIIDGLPIDEIVKKQDAFVTYAKTLNMSFRKNFGELNIAIYEAKKQWNNGFGFLDFFGVEDALDDIRDKWEDNIDIYIAEWKKLGEIDESTEAGKTAAKKYLDGMIAQLESDDKYIVNAFKNWLKETLGAKFLEPEDENGGKGNEPQLEWVKRVKDDLDDIQKQMPKNIKYLQGIFEGLDFTIKLPENQEDYEEYYKLVVQWVDKIRNAYNRALNDTDKLVSKEETEALKMALGFAEQYLATVGGGKQKKETTSKDKIPEQIRVLKELHKSYIDLNDIFDKTTSKKGAIEKFGNAFKEAFNVNIDTFWKGLKGEKGLQLDFTTEEGIVAAFDKLIARIPDQKKRVQAELAKAEFIMEYRIQMKKDQDQDLKNELQKVFDDYDMGLELDKLGISGDFANALFNIESIDLDQLRDVVEQYKDQFVGRGMLDEWQNFEDKLTEIEVKARQERMEGYLEYTRTTISQRAQLELKAMRDLANARKDIQDEEVLSQVESGIQKKLSQDLDKLNWEAFKSSDVFVKIFNDLDNVSQDALKSMIKQLNDYKDEWKNLPIQEMKEVATQLEKMEKALAMKKAGDNPFSLKSIRSFAEQAKSREEVSNAQKDILEADKLLLKYKSQEESLQTINQLVNEKKNATQAIVEYNTKYGTNLETQWADQQDILNMTKEQTDNLQNLAKKETERKENAQGIVDANEAYLFALQKQYQYLGDSLQMANDLYGAFENVLAVCDEWGAELDESVAIFAQAGMDMTNTVIQTIQLQIQLNIAAQEATGLGIAMNAAMGIIGWIVMAVQLLTTALSAIAKAHDNSLQKQIEHDAEAVELLQKRFDKLEKAIDNAMSFGQYQKEFDEAKRNLDEQIRLTRDMIALEEAKKKTDKDAIKGYKDEIEDYNEQLKEIEEKRYEDMGGFGSDEAYKDAAESFIDAWLSAYKETGDGLEALQGQWDEYFDNLVKKQMIMHIANKYIKGLLEQVDKAIGRDGIVTGDEMANLKAMAEQSSIEWNAIMKQFADAFGIEGLTDGTKLEGLSESIQGVTEVTAQALEAILNSMRFYVIDNNKQLIDIANTLLSWESPTSPILAELKAQTSYLSSIESLFNSVVDRNGSPAVRVR